MTIVDEDGRLFGYVNVFDAFVVLAVLAILGGGLVVAGPLAGDGGGLAADDDDGDEATRYATVDLGAVSPAVAERLSAGDTARTEDGAGNLTVTDAYVGPGENGNVSVVVRVRVAGTLAERDGDEPAFEYDDSPLRRGDSLALETSEYAESGEVVDLSTEGRSLSTDATTVLVEATVSDGVAAHLETGDEYRLADRTVVTLDESIVPPAGRGPNRSALLGLTVQTIEHSGETYFGSTRLAVGRPLQFRTGTYWLSGSVTRLGNASSLGETATATAEVKLADVPPEIADGIEAGMVERRDGTTTARITDARTEPASVVLTSDDGNIYVREHPTNVDVTLTVELRTRRTDDGLRFHADPLREGSVVALDLRTIVVEGTVVELEQTTSSES